MAHFWEEDTKRCLQICLVWARTEGRKVVRHQGLLPHLPLSATACKEVDQEPSWYAPPVPAWYFKVISLKDSSFPTGNYSVGRRLPFTALKIKNITFLKKLALNIAGRWHNVDIYFQAPAQSTTNGENMELKSFTMRSQFNLVYNKE